MKVYHGTSESVARAAMTEGLKTRDELGIKSHWDQCPSRGDLVYLTQAYAGYFGFAASEPGGKIGILEIDLDLLDADLVLPDEDFIEQGTRGHDDQWQDHIIRESLRGLDMAQRTEFFRDNLTMFSGLWEMSLEGLGNCAYMGSIPPEAITRICIYDPKKNGVITGMLLDPCISLMNYRFCGSKYRALCRWLIGDQVNAGDLLMTPGIDCRIEGSDPHGMMQQWVKQLEDLQVDLDQGAGRDLIQ